MAPKVALGAPKWLRKWLLELDWPESWPEASANQRNATATKGRLNAQNHRQCYRPGALLDGAWSAREGSEVAFGRKAKHRRLYSVFRVFWAFQGTSWEPLGHSWGALGRSGAPLGPSEVVLGGS